MSAESKDILVELTPDEIRYLVACGAALIQNIPADSLSTYTKFNKQQVIDFSIKMRDVLDRADLDM